MEWIGCGILFAIIMIWYRIEKGGDGMLQVQKDQLVVLRDIHSRLEEIGREIRITSQSIAYREVGAADPADPELEAAMCRELEELLRRKQT
jgi:hypothetical protein